MEGNREDKQIIDRYLETLTLESKQNWQEIIDRLQKAFEIVEEVYNIVNGKIDKDTKQRIIKILMLAANVESGEDKYNLFVDLVLEKLVVQKLNRINRDDTEIQDLNGGTYVNFEDDIFTSFSILCKERKEGRMPLKFGEGNEILQEHIGHGAREEAFQISNTDHSRTENWNEVFTINSKIQEGFGTRWGKFQDVNPNVTGTIQVNVSKFEENNDRNDDLSKAINHRDTKRHVYSFRSEGNTDWTLDSKIDIIGNMSKRAPRLDKDVTRDDVTTDGIIQSERLKDLDDRINVTFRLCDKKTHSEEGIFDTYKAIFRSSPIDNLLRVDNRLNDNESSRDIGGANIENRVSFMPVDINENQSRFCELITFLSMSRTDSFDVQIPHELRISPSDENGDYFLAVDVTVGRNFTKIQKRRFSFRLNIVRPEDFESAVRNSYIHSLELTYTNIFPSNCRMFIGLPIYRGGLIHSKDELRNQL